MLAQTNNHRDTARCQQLSQKLIYFLLLLLIACSTNNSKHKIVRNIYGFEVLIGQFAHHVELLWGHKEILLAGPKDYVKYSDHYQTRSHIDFEHGYITIETVSTTNSKKYLQKAIVNTLLMGEDINNSNTFDEQEVIISHHPLLYEQVLDHHHKPINMEQNAFEFASYILATRLKKRISDAKLIFSITIPLIPSHLSRRAHRYMKIIQQAGERYNIDTSLILAIIQTESSFNPYAVSTSNALGLMQVVPNSAGRDVFRHMKHCRLVPTRRSLFNPRKNIDIGTAYLHLLQKTYLAKIINPVSQRYAMISSYNGGIGNMLNVFSFNTCEAIAIINKLSPEDVYRTLITKHPLAETRDYLRKVNQIYRNYYRTLSNHAFS